MSCNDGDLVSEMVRRFDFDPASDTWSRADSVGGPLLRFRSSYAKDRVSAIAVVPSADGEHDRVYVAIGAFPDRKGALAVTTPVWRSDDSGATWVPASTGLAPENFVNCLVLDRTIPDRVFAGCDAGVFRSDDGGVSWQPFSEGLPNVQVFDLQIQPRTAMLRAATHGWAVWERGLSATAPDLAPSDARLLLRDVAAVSRPNPDPLPAIPPFEDDLWRRGADLKVQARNSSGKFSRPRSTVDHERGGPPDHLGFESFDDDTPDARSSVRVHLQIHNQGPAIARSVRARVFIAAKSAAGFPDLHPDFWSAFGQDRTSAGPWRPIGDTITIGEILPGEPAVVTWTWTVPDDAPKNAGLFAVVTSPDDTNDEIDLSIQSVARFNEKALLKEITIDNQISWARRHWKDIAAVAGLVVVAGIGVGIALAQDDD
jgi:hypothetical protein